MKVGGKVASQDDPFGSVRSADGFLYKACEDIAGEGDVRRAFKKNATGV